MKIADLGIDHLLEAEEHSERLVLGSTQILLKATRFPLRRHYTRRRLLGRVENYLSVRPLQRQHFLRPTQVLVQENKATKKKIAENRRLRWLKWECLCLVVRLG
jgi:hypothetical protein